MKNIFFKVNFDDSIQNGINEFARLSGYTIKDIADTEKKKVKRGSSILYLLLISLLIMVLLSTFS